MRKLLEATPQAIERFVRERPNAPVFLPEFTVATLPPAGTWKGAVISLTDLGVPGYSDGTDWFPITLGAAL